MKLRFRMSAALVLASLAAAAAFGARAQQASERPPTPVEVAAVAIEPLAVEATAVGTLLSNESVVLRPEIEGRIVKVGFDEGQPVDAGQQLFELDASVYEAELADAEARLSLADQNFQRARELFDKGAGTARGLDEARADFQVAQAAVELARARLTKTTIEAPFEGVVGLRRVSVGDYVTAGQDMVNLEDVDPVKVEFSVPERYLGALESGQHVQVAADAFPGRTFAGEIYAINPQIDPAGRSIQARALIPNDDRILRPGLFVRVKVELGRREEAIMIPEQAIVPRGKDRFVFKVVDGKAVETRVEVGHRRYGTVEIVEGLGPKDVVVTAGQLKIRDGAPVRPVNPPAADTGGGNRTGDAAKGS